jgi:hypothetical protein
LNWRKAADVTEWAQIGGNTSLRLQVFHFPHWDLSAANTRIMMIPKVNPADRVGFTCDLEEDR